MDWKAITPIVGAIASLIGACLAAYFAYINIENQKSRKKSDLVRLLKAELTALKNHCEVVSLGISEGFYSSKTMIITAKYNNGDLIFF